MEKILNNLADYLSAPFSMGTECAICGEYTEDIVAYIPYTRRDGTTGFVRTCEDCGDKYKSEEILRMVAEKAKKKMDERQAEIDAFLKDFDRDDVLLVTPSGSYDFLYENGKHTGTVVFFAICKCGKANYRLVGCNAKHEVLTESRQRSIVACRKEAERLHGWPITWLKPEQKLIDVM